ncbi:MAG: hypothetical protein LLG06_01095 [Desulfobacteraceae bacterium]|nr:hypothetical protein [Desulfobacteraceae bacterium]
MRKSLLAIGIAMISFMCAVLPAKAEEIWVSPAYAAASSAVGNWATTVAGSTHFTFSLPENMTFVGAKVLVIGAQNAPIAVNLKLSLARDDNPYYQHLYQKTLNLTVTKSMLQEIDVSSVFSDASLEWVPGIDYAALLFNVKSSSAVKVVGLRFVYDRGQTPSGIIAMWSGRASDIPPGWALCNGQSGTPDLRDRFVLGAGNAYGIGATGGEATHTLTIGEIPQHAHQERVNSTNGDRGGYIQPTGQTANAGGPTTTNMPTTLEAGGGQPHNNMPPFYALCFIMKL